MKRAYRIKYCKQCGKVIDNSGRKMNKRTKYCSNDCHEDYLFDRRLRNAELRKNAKETNKEKRRNYDSST
tara:strand:- start:38 stop:247 length:210 start_codon:yes stop_codon:yes gene_type:complete